MKPTEITVLLVEDDSIDVMNVQRAFSKNNITYPLHIAHNGIEALNLLRGTNGKPRMPLPKVVLLDINMPRVSGFDVLGAMKSDPALCMIPVVMLAGTLDPQKVQKSYELGANAHLVKPVNFGRFADFVRTLGDFWLTMNESPAASVRRS